MNILENEEKDKRRIALLQWFIATFAFLAVTLTISLLLYSRVIQSNHEAIQKLQFARMMRVSLVPRHGRQDTVVGQLRFVDHKGGVMLLGSVQPMMPGGSYAIEVLEYGDAYAIKSEDRVDHGVLEQFNPTNGHYGCPGDESVTTSDEVRNHRFGNLGRFVANQEGVLELNHDFKHLTIPGLAGRLISISAVSENYCEEQREFTPYRDILCWGITEMEETDEDSSVSDPSDVSLIVQGRRDEQQKAGTEKGMKRGKSRNLNQRNPKMNFLKKQSRMKQT